MKELKVIDENTVIRCFTKDEANIVARLTNKTFGLWSPDWDCIHATTGQIQSRLYWENGGNDIISAANFIRLNTDPSIPSNWCVRRTPENAEVLNAWYKHNMSKSGFNGSFNDSFADCNEVCVLYKSGSNWDLLEHAGYPEITFDQWQSIPENAEWLKENGHKFPSTFVKELTTEKVEEREIIGCEIDKNCQYLLRHYWPSAVGIEDVKHFKGEYFANRTFLLTGGFPCQPYSSAGKRLGNEDDRHLWPEMLRIIREVQPVIVVGENVNGLVNWNEGLVFNEVQTDLENQGFKVTPVILPACSINAPLREQF